MESKNPPDYKKHMLFFGIIAAVIIIDQMTKAAIEAMLPLGKNMAVIPNFFYIWHMKNTGAGFSLFAGMNAILIWISIAIIGIILFNYDKIISSKPFLVAFSLILGGAIGNLLDRIFQGYVTDFISFFIIFDFWPAFNIADAAVSIGAAIIVITMLFKCDEDKGKSDEKKEQAQKQVTNEKQMTAEKAAEKKQEIKKK